MRPFEHIFRLKQEIKRLSAEQLINKQMRKTSVNNNSVIGEGTWVYAAKHAATRSKLRRMFVAYAILRGKTPSYPKKKAWDKWDKHYVNQYLETYKANGEVEAVRNSA